MRYSIWLLALLFGMIGGSCGDDDEAAGDGGKVDNDNNTFNDDDDVVDDDDDDPDTEPIGDCPAQVLGRKLGREHLF